MEMAAEKPMSLVERVADHVKAKFLSESSGHDWYHILRVWRLARQIAVAEGANREVAELGALLHDIADWKFHGGDEAIGPREAERLLLQEGAPDKIIDAVVHIVASVSFKGAGVRNEMRSLEGLCVQDADRLDAIGAIGIARCFAYGGYDGRQIHDPDVPPVVHQTAADYKSARGASINHFHEKLLLLKDRMNTASGRALAEERHRYMEDFVRQFLREWGDC